MVRKLTLLVIFAALVPVSGFAEDTQAKTDTDLTRARMGDTKATADFQKLIDRSAEVYRAVAKGPQGQVPASVTQAARCVAVLPNVVAGALVVGGAHGEGLATCKTSDGAWSAPAVISLDQGSIGLQAGAKSTDLVLFFLSDESTRALKKGSFELGTEVGVVAGKYDTSLDLGRAGVVAYSRTEGVFAGASITGSRVGKDQSEISRAYGRPADFTAILEGREAPPTNLNTKKLTELMPS